MCKQGGHEEHERNAGQGERDHILLPHFMFFMVKISSYLSIGPAPWGISESCKMAICGGFAAITPQQSGAATTSASVIGDAPPMGKQPYEALRFVRKA